MDPTSLGTILLIVTGISLLGLAGGLLLLWNAGWTKRTSHYFMSFAAGGMLGAAFLDLLPEALEAGETTFVIWWVLFGIVGFFTVEKLLVWHHHSHEHDEETGDAHPSHYPQRLAMRPLVILGDGLHNFLDGAVLAVAFLVEPNLGWIAALAVLAHEIPQEVGDFSILLNAGMARGRVVGWNLLGALLATVGALVGFFASEAVAGIELPLLGFAAGNFIYIALADLLPSIQHERKFGGSLAHVALVVAGIGLLYSLGRALPHVGV